MSITNPGAASILANASASSHARVARNMTTPPAPGGQNNFATPPGTHPAVEWRHIPAPGGQLHVASGLPEFH